MDSWHQLPRPFPNPGNGPRQPTPGRGHSVPRSWLAGGDVVTLAGTPLRSGLSPRTCWDLDPHLKPVTLSRSRSRTERRTSPRPATEADGADPPSCSPRCRGVAGTRPGSGGAPGGYVVGRVEQPSHVLRDRLDVLDRRSVVRPLYEHPGVDPPFLEGTFGTNERIVPARRPRPDDRSAPRASIRSGDEPVANGVEPSRTVSVRGDRVGGTYTRAERASRRPLRRRGLPGAATPDHAVSASMSSRYWFSHSRRSSSSRRPRRVVV